MSSLIPSQTSNGVKYIPFIIVGIAIVVAVGLVLNSRFQENDSLQDTNGELALSNSPESQINNEGGVTVKVTPRFSSLEISLEIVLDTHSGALDADLVRVTVLKDETGKKYMPIRWDGSPLGGHHREGVLSFGVISPQPQTFEITIQDVGGIPERLFTWNIK